VNEFLSRGLAGDSGTVRVTGWVTSSAREGRTVGPWGRRLRTLDRKGLGAASSRGY